MHSTRTESPARRSRLLGADEALLAAAGLPLRPRRPDPQPARPDPRPRRGRRGDRRPPLRGRQRGARSPQRAAAPALEEIGIDSTPRAEADPDNTRTRRCSSTSSAASAPPRPNADRSTIASSSCAPPVSAAKRSRSRSEVARLLAAGTDPEQIAIVVRDPARRGPLIASVLESYGIPTALEAEIPVATTSVGGSLIALLDAISGPAGRRTCCATCAARPASPDRPVDWFERRLRRNRIQTAAAALRLWEEKYGGPPEDCRRHPRGRRQARRRAPPPRSARAAATAMGRPAAGIASWRRSARRRSPTAMAERAELDGLAPLPDSIGQALAGIAVRAWSGPVEDRVRIADPYRVRAARFDHVFVASLQDGEFPRGGGAPTRSSPRASATRSACGPARHRGRGALPLPCLPGAAARRLFLSFRDSNENGAAEAPSPLLDEISAAAGADRRRGPDRSRTYPRPRARRGRPPGRRRAVGDRAGAGDRRQRRREPTPRRCSRSPAPGARPPDGSPPGWRRAARPRPPAGRPGRSPTPR